MAAPRALHQDRQASREAQRLREKRPLRHPTPERNHVLHEPERHATARCMGSSADGGGNDNDNATGSGRCVRRAISVAAAATLTESMPPLSRIPVGP